MTGAVVSLAAAEASAYDITPSGSARFGAKVARIADRAGLRKLGAMLTVVPPGRRAFPFHAHHANDEMFVILSGSGEVRIGEAVHPIAAGDVVGCPAGGAETAHQIVNTGTEPLRYLSVSTMLDPEVVEYPDSGKWAALSIGEGRDFQTALCRHIFRREQGLDYWEGES